jgi:hypothetical protein
VAAPYPIYPEDLANGFIDELISASHPGTRVSLVSVLDARGFGTPNVSTSALVVLRLDYADNPRGLPKQVVVKMGKADDWPARGITLKDGTRQRPPRTALYANEVQFYKSLGGEAVIRAPRALGAGFDTRSGRFAIALEDLAALGARFPSQFDTADEATVHALLDGMASLHAAYWATPRFESDLAWLAPPGEGAVAECIYGPVQSSVADEAGKHKFKRELLGRIDATPETLFGNLATLQRHQSRLPQTMVHGDAHFGNTYRLPDGTAGFYDWQLAGRGFCIQDVAYLLVTTLSIDQRRRLERDYLRFYQDALRRCGVQDVPSFDILWLEYRRAMQWCVTIGWMPCPAAAYGWELVVIANNRTTAAYEDLETAEAIKELN